MYKMFYFNNKRKRKDYNLLVNYSKSNGVDYKFKLYKDKNILFDFSFYKLCIRLYGYSYERTK